MELDTVLTDLTDLHQHLGFSSTAHFLWELAHEQGIRLKEKNYWKFIDSITVKAHTTQKHYHALYDITQLIQSSPYAVEKAVHNAVSYSYRKSNVTTIEIKLNPMRRNKGGEHDLDKILLGALYGMKKACLEYPIKAGLLIELDRRFSPEQNAVLVEKAIAYQSFGVVGIDLSGPENKDFKINQVVKLYEKARKAGLGLTIHTGELPPVEEVEEVLQQIKPHRIGHGIRAVDSKKVMKLLTDRNIILELCPTSNVATGVAKDWSEVKKNIEILKAHNVSFTINSDSPTMIHTNVKEEFVKLYNQKILTLQDIKKIKQIAKKASFITN